MATKKQIINEATDKVVETIENEINEGKSKEEMISIEMPLSTAKMFLSIAKMIDRQFASMFQNIDPYEEENGR